MSPRARPAIARLVVAFFVAAYFFGSISDAPTLIAGRLFISVTTIGVACVLAPWPRYSTVRRMGATLAYSLIVIWALCCAAFLMYASWGAPVLKELVWSLSIPNLALAIRSVAHVVVIAAIAATVLRLSLTRRWRALFLKPPVLVTGCIVVAVVAWTTSMASQNYSAVWLKDFSGLTRSLAAFDLCNNLWLGAIIPFAVLRAVFPFATNKLLTQSILTRRGWTIESALLLVPLGIGVVGNWLFYSGGAALDDLGLHWWIRKTVAIGLWTGCSEEVSNRLVILTLLFFVSASFRNRKAAWRLAIVGSAMLFGVAHWKSGAPVVAFAALSGICYGVVVVRSKNIESCILAHTVTTALLARWTA